jgi:hypothetical protein
MGEDVDNAWASAVSKARGHGRGRQPSLGECVTVKATVQKSTSSTILVKSKVNSELSENVISEKVMSEHVASEKVILENM